ncbi:MAG: hypothetical protein KZQ79_15870 [Candidatus Thiodiazotropha sp. (ex Lucinoma borealis)]|nr:hypothetical protein [Candidatus Thiodiazotropha sp. (ex Lucinoma borealis)]
METETKHPSHQNGVSWTKTLAKIVAFVLVIVLLNVIVSVLIDKLEIQIWPEHLEIVDRAVLLGVILYIGLMAIPFMPGIEMGLALMIMLGPKGVLVVYISTLIALTISFGLGKVFPTHLLVSLLQWLNLTQAAALLKNFDTIPPEERLQFLSKKTSKQSLPLLLKHRYLILALLLNLPGNTLIGGGGGIAMTAGMSRLYSFPKYLFLISIAILPGPILIMLSSYIPR